jgi:hypothetical protein
MTSNKAKFRTHTMDDGTTHTSSSIDPGASDGEPTETEKSLLRLLASIDWESLTQNSKGE